MTDLIPAAPGWYVDADGELEPVIAWTTATNSEGDNTVLPLVPDNRGLTPWLVNENFIKEFNCKIVYLPNYDPAEEAEPQ
ncbi:hypothetical protein ACFSL4_17820 [Streptomyces caeni]|uniref:Uncharacterized protein n=1 Tax=Streptomyces caeni TaxID=2307231 RepID=A0ABW4ISX5_9ACTN